MGGFFQLFWERGGDFQELDHHPLFDLWRWVLELLWCLWVCHLACWCVTMSVYWASRSSWRVCHLGPIDSNQFMLCPQVMPFLQRLCPVPLPPVSICLTSWLTALGYKIFVLVHRHLPMSPRVKPMERGNNQNPNLLQIWHNEPKVTVSHLLGLGAPMLTCAGVLSCLKLRARISGCALITKVHVGLGNTTLLEWGGTHSCLTSYLTSRSVNSVIYVNFIIFLPPPKNQLCLHLQFISAFVFFLFSFELVIIFA